MKRLLLITSLFALALPLQARTFTKADGSGTISGQLISYNPKAGKVVLKVDGRSARVTAKASLFSAEDIEYFQEFHRKASKGKALKVSSKVNTESIEPNKEATYQWERQNETYTISVRNNSELEFDSLNVKYDIYVSKFDKEGKKVLEVTSGEKTTGKVFGKYTEQVVTEPVLVTLDCSTRKSCPKCIAKASKVKRERVLGVHARVYDDEGTMLTEYFSSNSAKAAAEKGGKSSS